MAKRKPKPTVPRTTRTRRPTKARKGRELAGLSERKVQALINAGWQPPVKRKRGRPQLEISADQVRKLAALFHTQREIAELLGCSVDTIAGRFSDAYWEGRAEVKSYLRRKQLHRAVKDGSDRMLVWLGKQELGQKDRHEISGDPDAPLVFEPIVPGAAGAAAAELPPGAAREPK